MMRNGTESILDLYLDYVGKSEVPLQYHLWCCLQMVAASVSNRVWLQKGRQRIAPNLYVALIGPSAIGKNEAIDTMLDVVRDQPRINTWRGKITAPAMLDQLAKPGPGVPWSHCFLITPELAWSMGKGDWADALVKQLTELYGGSTDTLREATRTGGTRRIQAGELCINWISGTTYAWLVQSIPADAISGGFFGRMVVVPAEYDFNTRYPRPILDPDWEMLRAMLRARLLELSHAAGEFVLTAKAKAIDDTWYNLRPAPTDMDIQAAWKRQHDFVLKLAMLLSLCDNDSLLINGKIMARAQQMSDVALRKMSQVIGVGALTNETRGLSLASEYVRRYTGPCPHTSLLKFMTKRGYDAEGLRKVLATLLQMRTIGRASGARGAAYVWLGHQRRYLPEAGEGNVIPLFPPREDQE